MQIIYNIFIFLYGIGLQIASHFHAKAKLWYEGRMNWEHKIALKIASTDKSIWVHCSSLGEFEQGRPVIERLKATYPKHKIVVSFFSPSGYEVRKDYSGVDLVFYLPLDKKNNAKKLIQLLNPSLLILVKYEYWYNLLKELNKNDIPVFVISAIFREKQIFFKAYGGWFRKRLQHLDYFFVQDATSKQLLESIQISQVSLAGDTRYDRVKEISKQDNSLDFISAFKRNSKLIVAGSTWPKDESYLLDLLQQDFPADWKLIIAPHNLNPKDIKDLQSKIKQTVSSFSSLNFELEESREQLTQSKVFILDTIGILTKVYAYADIAYVGGGFEKGIHNSLEPATFGIPVVFGPKFEKFTEAVELTKVKAALVVEDQTSFIATFHRLMKNEDFRKTTGNLAGDFVHNAPNATEMIMKAIHKKISAE